MSELSCLNRIRSTSKQTMFFIQDTEVKMNFPKQPCFKVILHTYIKEYLFEYVLSRYSRTFVDNLAAQIKRDIFFEYVLSRYSRTFVDNLAAQI